MAQLCGTGSGGAVTKVTSAAARRLFFTRRDPTLDRVHGAGQALLFSPGEPMLGHRKSWSSSSTMWCWIVEPDAQRSELAQPAEIRNSVRVCQQLPDILFNFSNLIVLPVHATTPFTTQAPNLQPVPLMDMGFAVIGQLARRRMPQIRFLYIGSYVCSTLLSDPASRRRPCASL
jgi:hypothetical protein